MATRRGVPSSATVDSASNNHHNHHINHRSTNSHTAPNQATSRSPVSSSSTHLTSSPSSASRITRSAARLAADATAASPSASAPEPAITPTQVSRHSRKRKATQQDTSPTTEQQAEPEGRSKRSKKQKVSEVTETAAATEPQTSSVRSQRARGKSVAMSAPGPSDSVSDNDSAPRQPQSSSKRKSSKNKKQATDTTTSTSTPRRQSKRSAKKSENIPVREPNEDEKQEGSGSGNREEEPEYSDDDEVHPAPDGENDDEDDDDEDDDPFSRSLFGRGHGSLSSTMRALSGMMSNSGTASRLREILESLKQRDDSSVQHIALQELSQLLLVSTEDNLSGHFAPDQFVKELVPLMQPNPITGEENPEIMLLACRCLANMMEALPPATASVVYGGAVPVLCAKLLEISYIDVAEQALSTLEKISVEFPASIVREGGLTACLTYLDFFANSTQRTAVTTAANCCRNIPEDSFGTVRDVMPILQNVLASSDQRVVEQGSLCVSRIVDSFKYHSEKLEELVKPDMLRAILRLLLPGSTNLIGPNIHTQFLRVLSITARASPNLSTELFKMDVIDTLYQILTGVSPPDDLDDVSSKIDGVVIMQALIHRPREQIFESLNVICELLPGMGSDNLLMKTKPPSLADQVPTSYTSRRGGSNSKRLELLEQCQDKVKRFATILLPTLTHAYSSTVNLSVRQKVLTAQLKMLSNLDVSILGVALRTVPFASYLASILSQQDHPALVMFALQAADLLLARMGDVYRYQFYREGVFTEVSKLAEKSISEPPAPKGQLESQKIDNGKQNASAGDNVAEIAGESHSESDDQDGMSAEGQDLEDMADDDIDDDEEDDEDHNDDDLEDEDGEDGEDEDINEPVLRGGHDGEESRSPSTASSPHTLADPRPQTMQDHMILCARALLEKMQDSKVNGVREKAEKVLNEVKNNAKDIRETYLTGTGDDGSDMFRKLSGHFSADALKSITSAELLSSGLIGVLLETFEDENTHGTTKARTDFLDAFMAPKNATSSDNETTQSAFSVLVHKLQDLLSRAEHFEVITVHQNSLDSNRSSAASMLAKQLRLKLVADDDSDIPKGYRNIMVSIHAIATFKALDDYLRPRISLSERPRSGRHHPEGMASSLAAFAAATGGLPSAAHQRLLDRGLLSGLSDASGIPPPPPPASGPASTNKKTSGRLPPKDSTSDPKTPAKQTKEKETDPPASTRRATRRHGAGNKPTTAETPTTGTEVQDNLECADERQLSDEGRPIPESLEAFVDDVDEEMDDNDAPDPSAVNMEIASTGKVTARQDDGTRVPTPQASTSHPPPPRARGPATPSAAARAMSYAAAINSTPDDWHIQFSIDDQVLSNDTTIYRAVHYNKSQPEELATRSVWSNIHPVKFKRVKGPPPSTSAIVSLNKESTDNALPQSLHNNPETSKILRLLNTLHAMNSNLDELLEESVKDGIRINAEPVAQFVNTKLTAKMNRQLEEPLIVASNCLPSWSEDLARLYPFLFPFETRHLFLQSTSFGYSRSMTRWQNSQTNDDSRDRHRDDRPFLGRLQRQKVRISRSRILESAVKVMELYGSSPSVLEVEYFEEVGTGLGPTLEFYSTVSKEFSKRKSKLWRENESNSKDEFAFSKGGLFPAPMSEEQVKSDNGKKILHLFWMLGKFVARSMLDSRIIDVSFNPLFFKEQRHLASVVPSLGVLKSVDADLASSLKLLKTFVVLKQQCQDGTSLHTAASADAVRDIRVNGASVDDLGLDFTLPGYPNIDLVENGSNIPVTIENVDTYLEHVLDFTLAKGVEKQIAAFRTGFSQVFPYSALKAFTPKELVMLFGRVEEDWSLETLMDSIKADHGFNMDSKSVRNLLHTMSELTATQRRDFLQFVTGSPKLPIGGFRSLTPMFTVVCRPSEPPYSSDDYLPSVMTCVNYLKLPDYSGLDIMRTRLFTAIKEGQGAFHLS